MSHAEPRRALIVIDVQNEYISGNFLIEYPPVSVSLPNILKAMDAAQAHAVPVVLVQHVLPEAAPIFAKGSHGVALHPEIASRPHAHLVTKTLPSTFAGTDFGAWLRDNHIDTLTIVGYMTHNCNDSTIRQAMHEGYAVELLHDASGSLPYANKAGSATAEEIHKAVIVVMQSAYAAVMATAEWIDNLATGKAAERDNIYASNQRAVAARKA
ncbi:cysteine hydrolase family protein [Chitinimonas naiadis]